MPVPHSLSRTPSQKAPEMAVGIQRYTTQTEYGKRVGHWRGTKRLPYALTTPNEVCTIPNGRLTALQRQQPEHQL